MSEVSQAASVMRTQWGLSTDGPHCARYVAISVSVMQPSLNLSIKELTSPGYIHCSPDEIWPSIIAADQTQLMWAIRKTPYPQFLKSPYWWAVSSKVKERTGGRCQLCNAGGKMHVHHRCYKYHGLEHEHMPDLVCLCEKHHRDFHAGRKVTAAAVRPHRSNFIQPGVLQGRAAYILQLARTGRVQAIPDKRAAMRHLYTIMESGRISYDDLKTRAETCFLWQDLVA